MPTIFRLLLMIVSCREAIALPKITVYVYDYSSERTAAIADALQAAGAILRQAGIDVRWQTCSVGRAAGCDVDPNDATQIVLSVLPEQMAAKIATGSKQFGLSIMNGEDGLPCHAYVFRDRILNFAEVHSVSMTLLLGNIVAHEIGHLLLGTNSHAPAGIMRSNWRSAEVKQALMSTLGFTRQQAKTMQANVSRRLEAAYSAASNSPPPPSK